MRGYTTKEIASKQLIQVRLMDLLKRIGADASYQIDSLQLLKKIVESGGGKLRLHVYLFDGSYHGFKI